MTTVQSKTDNILFREYTHGQGSIKGSPDAPLLWSRGSSSGASSGNPAAESHLKDLAEAWQGLRRIVHGHTPTVGSGDFDSVTGGKSTTVSYLSENPNRQNSRGRANKIRVYNIDEGMSPPYYSGDDSIYSITRMPTGLRIETDEFSSLEANSSTDKLVKINPDHSIDIDSRDLWKWSENEWRISAKPNWGTSDDKFMYQIVEHGSWKGYISTKKSDESTRTLWDRNAGTTQVSKLMIQKAMSNFFSQNSVVVQEPRPVVLERITPIGIPLSRNNVKEAWSKIDVFLLLAKPNKKGGMSIIFINSTDKELDINVNNLFSKKMMKPRELTCKAKSYGIAMINNCEKIFISTNSKIIDDSRLEWVDGKNTIKPNTAPVIGYFSGVEKPHKKVEISNEKFVDLLTTLPKVESKKNKVSSNKLWESSRVRGTSLNSQGKGFTPPHQKQNQIIENSTEKILTHRPTQKMRTPTIKTSRRESRAFQTR